METSEQLETQTADNETSPLSETASHETTATVDKEASTTSLDAKGSESSAEQDKNNVLRNPKAAMEILGKDLPEVAAEEQENAESDKSKDSKSKSVQADAEKSAVKDEQAEKTAKAENDANALFHKRPEWAELTTALGEEAAKKARPIFRKVLESNVALNAQLNQAKPDLDEIKTLKQTVGDEQNWKFYRQVTEGFAKGDPNLIPVLEKMVEQMKTRNGMIVQSPDLKQKMAKIDQLVTDQQITSEDAQEQKSELLEVEKSRAAVKMTQQQLEAQRQQVEQQRQEQVARSNENALNEWETNIRSKYSDFGNVTDENDPQHGVSMADQVMSELSSRLQVKPPANQQELVAMAQKAFEVVERRMKHFQPQPKSFKPVTSESSSRTAKPAPKSFKEAVDSASGILFGSQS